MAAGMHSSEALSTVPTNSNCWTKLLLVDGGSGFGVGGFPRRGTGSYQCDVGSEERMRCWLRRGTYKTAQPRGV